MAISRAETELKPRSSATADAGDSAQRPPHRRGRAPASPAPRAWERARHDRTYRPGLDGLRAIAIVGVLLYHAGVGWVPGGLLGVDLFFVVSGFLITSLLVVELHNERRIALGAFYRRRSLRLLPALGGVLFVTAVALVSFWPNEVARFRGDLVASTGYVTNWWFIVRHQSYFIASGRPSPFQHLWSLAVEEQFYLVWPLLLLTFRRRLTTQRSLLRLGLVAFAGACASAGLMAAMAIHHNLPYGADSSRVYFGTDTHAFGLLIGSAAAAILAAGAGPMWQRRPARRLRLALDAGGAASLVVVCWVMLRTTEFSPGLYRGGFWAFSVVSGVGVVAASRPGGPLERALGGKVMRWVGTRSYGLYLWHWPVFVFTRPQLDLALTGTADLLFRLGIVVVLAEVSYRLIERPIRSVGLRLWFAALLLRVSTAGEWLQGRASRVQRRWEGRTRWDARTPRALRIKPPRPGRVRRMPAGQLFMAATIAASILLLIAGGEHHTRARGGPSTNPVAAQISASRSGPVPVATPEFDAPTAPPAPRTYTVVGDSVMRGALDVLKAAMPGATVDAVEGRQASVAFDIVNGLAGRDQIGTDVVLHIGTNGTIQPSALDAVLARVSRSRVVLLTDHVPRPWQDLNNRILTEAAHNHPNVHLADWNAAASAHPEWLWPDGIHLRPEGAAAYRDLIADALR